MAKFVTSGYRRWLEVKSFEGKRGGEMTGREGFRDVVTGQLCVPENGWNGEPPPITGDLFQARGPADKYRENYDQINWER